jgi:hypothetical protein
MKFRSSRVLFRVFSLAASLLFAPMLSPNLLFGLSSTCELSVQSSQLRVYVTPESNVKWAIGGNFTVDVVAENLSGMRGIYFELYWIGFYDPRVPDWFPVLNTSLDKIDVYENLLPKPYKVYSLTFSPAPEKSWLKFLCILDCNTAPQNGTARIMSITFNVLDPWYCGRQPCYTRNGDKWIPTNATTQIAVWWGYSILQYPYLHCVYFGEFYGMKEGFQGYALYGNSEYTFMPIPGDLDENGIVDAKDLLAITQLYNKDLNEYPNRYYDLNGDGVIDVYDIVIVTSNFGRATPVLG